MKRIFAALVITIAVTASCLAQNATAPVNKAPVSNSNVQASVKPVEKKIVIGKVELVSLANPTKGIKSEVSVVDDTGNKHVFLVESTTTIYDTDWKATTLDKINKDQKIKIKYNTTKEGVNEVLSISAMK